MMQSYSRQFAVMTVVMFVAACGSEPTQNNLVGAQTDTTAGNDGATSFGDTSGSTDSDATGDTSAGTDEDSSGSTDGDATSTDGGCERDSDCANLEHSICQIGKCNLQTGQCFVAEDVDDTVCDDGDPCTEKAGVCKSGKCEANALVCDDNNPCTTDTCNAATGCAHTAAADKASCDDANACTKDDVCDADGACKGTLIDCDDSSPCTLDSCDPGTGCQNLAADGACDDGDLCTENDACAGGKCTGSALACDDGNPCTDNSCDKADGCKKAFNTATCDDGDACTKGDICDGAGSCTPAGAVDCDDGNPCTDDSCDKTKGCAHAAIADGGLCDDGDACTKGDACKAGKCETEAVSCDDKNPCTVDTCDKAKGCVSTADDNLGCDDGDVCTTSDACKAGVCGGKAVVDCEDNNPCTDDVCNPADKTCKHTNNIIACDDGSLCTTGDACADGKCVGGTPIDCDDKNGCTADSCDAASGTCTNENSTLPCDDGEVCTDKDTCADGKCVGTAKDCNDDNSCTDDSCNAKDGKCAHVNLADATACDDGSLCTSADACKGGACNGTAVACDDGNPCTDDSCDKAKGCLTKANTATCEDGDACTLKDTCKDGACAAGATAPNCDDGNPCTEDSCDKEKGCVAVNSAKACDDGSACTENDNCTDGKCTGTNVSCADSNICTTDKCDPKTGCGHTNNTVKCSDASVCTENDVCKDGKCSGTAIAPCNDGNPCTTDTCDPKKGCLFTNVAAKTACDDGNACTTGDACDAAGKCVGVGKSCDDGNPCTVDSCANNVCTSKPEAAKTACNDNDSCTQLDACDGKGKCVGANPVKCDDGNPCTDDVCVNGQGCKSTVNTAPCDDGKYCTDKDVCKSGKCTSGAPRICDDGNSCTSDLCDEIGAKCATFPKLANTPCNDANACTTGDTCDTKGTCVAKPIVCNDDNPCTNDACDTKTGKCAYTLNSCPARKVPDIEGINYLDADWHLTSSDTAVKWQADATPAVPGALTGGASLNFNNGTNFSNGKSVSGTALAKYFYDATAVTGSMTLTFLSYNGVETLGTYDKRYVELSTDGFVTVAQTVVLDNAKNSKVWWAETIDISGLKGKKFQLRFRFDSVDAQNNTTPGWFIDEVAVYAGAVVKVSNAGTWQEGFAAGNSSGWHLSAPSAGNASVWAMDKTPAIPGGYEGESLNFNDGVDFANGSAKAAGWAMSPVIDLTGVTTGNVTMWFKSWSQGEASTTYDKRWIDVSALGFSGTSADLKVELDNSSALQAGWRWEAIDLTKFKGQKVRLRFNFDSIDGASNAFPGWFVDDLIVDNIPAPVYADMVHTGEAANWTLNNSQTPAGWAIDNTGITALSANASINFNANISSKYQYTCPTGKTSVVGTATSKIFSIPSTLATGGKFQLDFDAFLDVESSTAYDLLTVEVLQFVLIGTPKSVKMTVPKTSLGKWGHFTMDVSALKGMTARIIFKFDSVDCTANATTGVAIDNVMLRATK